MALTVAGVAALAVIRFQDQPLGAWLAWGAGVGACSSVIPYVTGRAPRPVRLSQDRRPSLP